MARVLLLILCVMVLIGFIPVGPNGRPVGVIGEAVDAACRLLGIRSSGPAHPNPSSNLRQICLAMMVYANESDGAWPQSLDQIRAWSDGELIPRMFRDPRWPDDPDPFTYVRPTVEAGAHQPVLLTRPRPGSTPLVIICYADGHVDTVRGTAVWEEAGRLAVLPKARVEGIAPPDWTTVPKPPNKQRRSR